MQRKAIASPRSQPVPAHTTDRRRGAKPPAPVFEHVIRKGGEWHAAKILDLTETTDQERVVGESSRCWPNRISYRPIDLVDARLFAFSWSRQNLRWGIPLSEVHRAIELTTTYRMLGLRPDTIEALPHGGSPKSVGPDGRTEWLP